MRAKRLLDIVEEHGVTQAIEDAILRWPKAGIAWEEITWAIMDNPLIGSPLIESGRVRALDNPGSYEEGQPTVRVVFEQTSETKITILAAEFSEATYQKAGRA